jgi:hypothetical protein
MKEPAASQLFDFFNSFENCNYMPELGLWFLRTMVMCPKNRPASHWGPVPVSNNCPTLEQTNKHGIHLLWGLCDGWCVFGMSCWFLLVWSRPIMSSFSQTWSTGWYIESLRIGTFVLCMVLLC